MISLPPDVQKEEQIVRIDTGRRVRLRKTLRLMKARISPACESAL